MMRYTWSNSVTEEDQKNSGVLKPVTLGMGLINSINEDPTIFKSLVIIRNCLGNK